MDEWAKKLPQKSALIFENKNLSYQELATGSDYLARYLTEKYQLKAGDRVLFLVKPTLIYQMLVFALLRVGIVPVFLDPGMGFKRLIKCAAESESQGALGSPMVLFMIQALIRKKASPFKFINVKSLPSKVREFLREQKAKKSNWAQEITAKDFDPQFVAAILFTSGGTGTPKGVEYTHQMFLSQIAALKDYFQLTPSDKDMAGFPLFSLFTQSMGLTTISAPLNPARPGQCDPKKIAEQLIRHQVSFAAGSPIIWQRVAQWALKEGIKFPHLKKLALFGAPVDLKLHQDWLKLLPADGNTFTPYGATECLPISSIDGRSLIDRNQNYRQGFFSDKGIAVGAPLSGVKIVISAEGEILVNAPWMKMNYFNNRDATEKSLREIKGEIYHNMGDQGYLDEKNQLWFLGRKTHQVLTPKLKTLDSVPVENTLRQKITDYGFSNVALICHEKLQGKVIIACERKESSQNEKLAKQEILNFAQQFEVTKEIEDIFIVKKFPVDARHNIKIDRVKLGEMYVSQ
jgi:acyl-CoA synthetase (AMP-forming)/AMP-acid ligase II